ncbi:MAG: alkaline phosphatase family protein [Verrucomicrobiota bacterium]
MEPKKKPKLPLFIFIDAFGWEVLSRHSFFLDDLAPHRKKLETILGYSSACDPSIVSGKLPYQHGLWSSFYYAPETSPFRWLRWFQFLPRQLTSRGRVRHWLSRIIKKIHGFTGYFQIYNVPFELLRLFDYAEKKRFWVAGGMPRGRSIFDELDEKNIGHYVHESSQSDPTKLARLRQCIEEQSIEFAYISLGKLDALMHAKGPLHPEVTDLVHWYDEEIRELIELANQYYEDVPFYVFTDHGMHEVKETCDLKREIEALGLVHEVDYTAFYDSTMGRFWCLNEKAKSMLTGFLSKHEQGVLLTDTELENLGVLFQDRQYGDLIYLMNPGTLIVPSYMGAKRIAGMHGFHPSSPDSAAAISSNRVLSHDLVRIEQIFGIMKNELDLRNEGKVTAPARP